MTTMFPELTDSESEELPAVPFLSQQPAAIKNPIQHPADEEMVVLCSSDSEGSSAPSPAWKKSRGPQELTRANHRPTHQNVMVQLSSESEEEEDIIPLAERLKRKFLATKPSAAGSSFTRILERNSGEAAGGNRLCNSYENEEKSLPRRPETEKRAAVSTWDLSDSEPKPVSSEPLFQPSVCATDLLMQNVSHQVTEISLQPFSLQTDMTCSQEPLDQADPAPLQRRKERAARKALQEQEREKRRALANLWKAQRPEQCLKHVQVVLDPGLLQVEGGGQVLTTLQAMECSCVIESQNVPCSITWRRKTRLDQAEEDDLTEEPNLLVLVLLEEFLTMIRNSKQVSMEGPTETLQAFVANIMQKTPGKTLALAVVELEKYFSSHKHKLQKKVKQTAQSGSEAQKHSKQRTWRGKASSVQELSRVDVEEFSEEKRERRKQLSKEGEWKEEEEDDQPLAFGYSDVLDFQFTDALSSMAMALVGLQLHTGVQVQILDSWKEFADFASMFTKAVAEAPFKRERDKTSFSFCLEGDWISGTKVDRSGKGLLQVWKRQIQQFNRVSLEVANAIVAQYPSPTLLMEAYHQCSSEQERYNLLRETPVRRGDGVTATTRRVGPELSKRIYLQMTSHNPDLSLDVTG